MSVASFLQSLGDYPQHDPRGFISNYSLAQGTDQDLGAFYPHAEVRDPFYFAQLLREASREGGVLSPLYSNRGYASQVGGIIAGERARQTETRRALGQAGGNPFMSSMIVSQDPILAQRQVAGARVGAEREIAENQFNAQQMMANVMVGADRQLANLALAAVGRKAQRRQQSFVNRFGMFKLGLDFLSDMKDQEALASSSGGP